MLSPRHGNAPQFEGPPMGWTMPAVTGLVLLAAGVSWLWMGQQGRKPKMSSLDQVFKIVEELVRRRPFTVDGVARATEKSLHPTPTASNRYFDIFESDEDPKATISKVELRAPSRINPVKHAGLVIFDLHLEPCVKEEAVKVHFGREPDTILLSYPEDPRRSLTHVYRFEWGELSFSFAQETGCLISAVIDRKK